jgi:hypothetical protein
LFGALASLGRPTSPLPRLAATAFDGALLPRTADWAAAGCQRPSGAALIVAAGRLRLCRGLAGAVLDGTLVSLGRQTGQRLAASVPQVQRWLSRLVDFACAAGWLALFLNAALVSLGRPTLYRNQDTPLALALLASLGVDSRPGGLWPIGSSGNPYPPRGVLAFVVGASRTMS